MTSLSLSPDEREQLIAQAENARTLLVRLRPEKSCYGCEHYAAPKTNPYCRHWKAAIPVEALEDGCAEFSMFVPF